MALLRKQWLTPRLLRGLWVGFCIALIIVGIVLINVWREKSRAIASRLLV